MVQELSPAAKEAQAKAAAVGAANVPPAPTKAYTVELREHLPLSAEAAATVTRSSGAADIPPAQRPPPEGVPPVSTSREAREKAKQVQGELSAYESERRTLERNIVDLEKRLAYATSSQGRETLGSREVKSITAAMSQHQQRLADIQRKEQALKPLLGYYQVQGVTLRGGERKAEIREIASGSQFETRQKMSAAQAQRETAAQATTARTQALALASEYGYRVPSAYQIPGEYVTPGVLPEEQRQQVLKFIAEQQPGLVQKYPAAFETIPEPPRGGIAYTLSLTEGGGPRGPTAFDLRLEETLGISAGIGGEAVTPAPQLTRGEFRREALKFVKEAKAAGYTTVSIRTPEGVKDVPISRAYSELLKAPEILSVYPIPVVPEGYSLAGHLTSPIFIEEAKRELVPLEKPQTIQDKIGNLIRLPTYSEKSRTGEAVPFDPTILIPIGAAAKGARTLAETLIKRIIPQAEKISLTVSKKAAREGTKILEPIKAYPASRLRSQGFEPLPSLAKSFTPKEEIAIQRAFNIPATSIRETGTTIGPRLAQKPRDILREIPQPRITTAPTLQARPQFQAKSVSTGTAQGITLRTETSRGPLPGIITKSVPFKVDRLYSETGRITAIKQNVGLGKGYGEITRKDAPIVPPKKQTYGPFPRSKPEPEKTFEPPEYFKETGIKAGKGIGLAIRTETSRGPLPGIITKSVPFKVDRLYSETGRITAIKQNVGLGKGYGELTQKETPIVVKREPLYGPFEKKVQPQKISEKTYEPPEYFKETKKELGRGIVTRQPISARLPIARQAVFSLGRSKVKFVSPKTGTSSKFPIKKKPGDEPEELRAKGGTILLEVPKKPAFTSTKVSLGKTEKAGIVATGGATVPAATSIGVPTVPAAGEIIQNITGSNQTEPIQEEIPSILEPQTITEKRPSIAAIRPSGYGTSVLSGPVLRTGVRSGLGLQYNVKPSQSSRSIVSQRTPQKARQISKTIPIFQPIQRIQPRELLGQRQRTFAGTPSPLRPQLRQTTPMAFKERPKLKLRVPQRPKEPKRAVMAPFFAEKKKKKKKTEESVFGKKVDFIGNVPVSEIAGVYGKRADILYGRKTSQLVGADIRTSSRGRFVQVKSRPISSGGTRYFTPSKKQLRQSMKL